MRRPPAALDHLEQPCGQRRILLRHEHLDVAAAGEPDLEGLLVGDPVLEQARLEPRQHLARLAEDIALDAAAGDRAGQLAALRHRELRSDRPRCTPPRGDDSGERHLLSAPVPALEILGELFHT